MSNRYAGLSLKEVDRLLVGIIGMIVHEELDLARRMTAEEWDEHDTFRRSHEIASCIYYAAHDDRLWPNATMRRGSRGGALACPIENQCHDSELEEAHHIALSTARAKANDRRGGKAIHFLI